MNPQDLLRRLTLPSWLTPPVLERLDIVGLLIRAYELGVRDQGKKEGSQRAVFFFPGDSAEVWSRILADLDRARSSVTMVSFLPPDRKMSRALTDAHDRLGDRVRVILDGTSQRSVGTFDLPFADRRILPEAGTIHAKLLLVDDSILWWGSWNFSRSATRQADVVERVNREADPSLLARASAWVEEIVKLSSTVDLTERARGPYRGSPEQAEVHPKDPDFDF